VTWRRVRLDRLIRIQHGFAFNGRYFSDVGAGPLVLTPGNFAVGGGFKHTRPKYYSGEIPGGYVLAPGDLVVTMTDLSRNGDKLGYPALIPNDATYLHNQRIGKVVIDRPDRLDSGFIYYGLMTRDYRTFVLGR